MPAAPHLPSEQLAEALRLLPRVQHGRAAVTRRALPYVLLAQHLVREDEVLLRIPAGQIEDRVLDGTVLAYHAHTSADWAEDAPGIQLIGTVTTVRPTPDERAAFPRPAHGPDAAGPEPGTDPEGTLYARLDPLLAAIRHTTDAGDTCDPR
jgi:hypothetical protein